MSLGTTVPGPRDTHLFTPTRERLAPCSLGLAPCFPSKPEPRGLPITSPPPASLTGVGSAPSAFDLFLGPRAQLCGSVSSSHAHTKLKMKLRSGNPLYLQPHGRVCGRGSQRKLVLLVEVGGGGERRSDGKERN